MKTHFSPDFFTDNRNRLRKSLGTDEPIVITGNGVMQRDSDEGSDFHQEANFWYLTGLNGADLTLVITKNDTFIIAPTRSFVREIFDGSHDSSLYEATSGIDTYLSERDGWKRLAELLRKSKSVATLGSAPEHMKHYGIYTLPYRRRLIRRLKRLQPGIAITDIRANLAALRSVKQPQELRAIRAAIDITTQTFDDIIKPDVLGEAEFEYQIEAAITYGFRMRGAGGHAFWPIVGAGKHTTTLHHAENNGLIQQGDLIVVDIGAEVEHYAADMTRTISKQPITGRQADVWKAVAEVQDYALTLLKPGVSYRDYETAVETRMGQELLELGLIREASRENIRHYFPTATSHFLGLNTHDAGDYKLPLQANMVLSCEPGIYIPAEGIGVRLEEDVLITSTGCEVLSSGCPRELTPVQ